MGVVAKVYLVRHGETDENRNGIIQGQLDTSLNIVGLEQARLVGEKFRSIPLTTAFSSDLSRAAKTAEAILVHHPDVQLFKQVELRERYMGKLQGTTVQTKLQVGSMDNRMESGAFFAARTESWWIEFILKSIASLPGRDEPYNVLVTTHGGFIGTLVRTLIHRRKASCAPGVVIERCFNSSVTVVEVDDEGQGIITNSGDTSHLRDLGGLVVQSNADEIGPQPS